jgi:hypothetical protein
MLWSIIDHAYAMRRAAKPHYRLRVGTVGRTERRLVWRCELMSGAQRDVNWWDWWSSSRAAIDAAGGRVFDALNAQDEAPPVDIRRAI